MQHSIGAERNQTVNRKGKLQLICLEKRLQNFRNLHSIKIYVIFFNHEN